MSIFPSCKSTSCFMATLYTPTPLAWLQEASKLAHLSLYVRNDRGAKESKVDVVGGGTKEKKSS